MFSAFDDFKRVSPSKAGVEFDAIPLPGDRGDYLAKSQNGSPVFLLADAKTGQYHPSLQLRYLSADFQLTCRLSTEGGEMEGVFALVSCSSDEPELHELFIRCFDAVRDQLGTKADTEDIKKTVQNLAALFRAFSLPSQRSITGLWAELFTVVRSSSIVNAMRIWRVGAFDRFDFSDSSLAIEVKATTGQFRSHEFSLEQLSSPVGRAGYVVSMLMQPITGGTSVLDLVSTIETQIATEPRLRQKLWENVINDLGSDFGTSLDRRFDVSYAQRNCMIFRFQDIPQPRPISDPRVAKVRFVADCSSAISSVTDSTFGGLQGLFSGVA